MKTEGKYILNGKKVVAENDLFKWAKWFERANRIVKQEELANGCYVSTVFLGIDHQFGLGKPLLFETMVFPGNDQYSELDMDRYSTWAEAEKGHKRLVKKWSVYENNNSNQVN